MKQILFVFLIIFIPFYSNAQFGYDVGIKVNSHQENRFQLENRFHFKEKISFLMNFGYNRWTMDLPKYYYEDYYTSALVIDYALTDYYQFKVGLQKTVVNNGKGATVYAGVTGGINIQETKRYDAYAELSFEYTPTSDSTGSYDLVYAFPRSVRNMEFKESVTVKEVTADLFCGLDYQLYQSPFYFTAAVHVYFDYIYATQPYYNRPYHLGIEMDAGFRFRIR